MWRNRGLILRTKMFAAGRPEMRTETYFYRKNPDKTIDAICPFGFMTAAIATNEADLHDRQMLHRCPAEAFVAGQYYQT
jgi:hypothetical protein